VAVLDDLRYSLAPILTADLDVFLQAIAAMFAETELWSLDRLDEEGKELPGYGLAFDVDNPDLPTTALPWLAQLVGETLPLTASDAAARAQIIGQPNRKRGTPDGITAAAQLTLTGTKTVFFVERSSTACPTDPAYGLLVGTLTAETPNAVVTEAAIRANLPGGIILSYLVVDGAFIDSGARTIDAGTAVIDTATLADIT
jgi:hypothetical protein